MSTRTQLKLEGLSEMTSAAHLEKTIEAIPGVQAVEMDVENQCVTVLHDHADLRKIAAIAREEGLRVAST